MGSLMESLVGALAGGCSGVAARPLRSRCAAVARPGPGAEVGRGSPRPLQGSARYITPLLLPGGASSSVIFPWAASYRSRASVSKKALSGSHVGCA